MLRPHPVTRCVDQLCAPSCRIDVIRYYIRNSDAAAHRLYERNGKVQTSSCANLARKNREILPLDGLKVPQTAPVLLAVIRDLVEHPHAVLLMGQRLLGAKLQLDGLDVIRCTGSCPAEARTLENRSDPARNGKRQRDQLPVARTCKRDGFGVVRGSRTIISESALKPRVRRCAAHQRRERQHCAGWVGKLLNLIYRRAVRPRCYREETIIDDQTCIAAAG